METYDDKTRDELFDYQDVPFREPEVLIFERPKAKSLIDSINAAFNDIVYVSQSDIIASELRELLVYVNDSIPDQVEIVDIEVLNYMSNYLWEHVDSITEEDVRYLDDRVHGMLEGPSSIIQGRYVKNYSGIHRFVPDGQFREFSDEELANMKGPLFMTLLMTSERLRYPTYLRLISRS